jgi:two-component system, LytTR family, response regulator
LRASETLPLEAPTSVRVRSAPIRVLIAEPDVVSRRLICSLVECELEMTAECVDDSLLLPSIQENPPDLVILDAAYDPVVLAAFASIAVDVLVKPFDVDRFETALCLAKSKIVRARTELLRAHRSSAPESSMSCHQFLQRLAVEAGEKIVLVRVEDIHWMQSSGKHIRIHVGKTSHLLRQSMKRLEAMLDPNRFLRVHRNAIVNLDHVGEFYLPSKGNMFVKLDNGASVPLRKGNRAVLRKLLKDIW